MLIEEIGNWTLEIGFVPISNSLLSNFSSLAAQSFDGSVLVSRAEGSHLIPYRTQQLSPPAPMVVEHAFCKSRPMPGQSH
jgi:hypothetical protein